MSVIHMYFFAKTVRPKMILSNHPRKLKLQIFLLCTFVVWVGASFVSCFCQWRVFFAEKPCDANPCKDNEMCFPISDGNPKYKNEGHFCFGRRNVMQVREILDECKCSSSLGRGYAQRNFFSAKKDDPCCFGSHNINVPFSLFFPESKMFVSFSFCVHQLVREIIWQKNWTTTPIQTFSYSIWAVPEGTFVADKEQPNPGDVSYTFYRGGWISMYTHSGSALQDVRFARMWNLFLRWQNRACPCHANEREKNKISKKLQCDFLFSFLLLQRTKIN